MAQAKQILYSPVDVDDADFESFSTEPSEDELEFEKFKNEFKQANEYAKVTCYRQPTTSDGRPGQKQLTFLFEAGVDEYNFSQLAGRLRDEYGNGTYRIQLRDKDNLMKMNRAISIEAPKVDAKESGGNLGLIIEQFSSALERQHNRQEQMFRALAPPVSSGDTIDQMTKIATAVATVMGALGIKPGANTPPTMVEQFKEMMMMKKFMDSFSDNNNSESGEANLYSVLGKTIEHFGGPIAAAIASGQASGEVNADGIMEPRKLNPPEPAIDPVKQNEEAMKSQIRLLISNAENKIDPLILADLVLEKTPEADLDKLFEFVSDENFFASVCNLVPEAGPHEEWFMILRNKILNELTEPEGENSIAEHASVESDTPEPVAETTDSDIRDTPNGEPATNT